MRTGQEVRYIDAKGNAHTATITEVLGRTGRNSNYKILNLSYTDKGKEVTVEKVAYQADAEPKQGFWLQKGERLKEEATPEPVDTVAFPEPPVSAPPSDLST